MIAAASGAGATRLFADRPKLAWQAAWQEVSKSPLRCNTINGLQTHAAGCSGIGSLPADSPVVFGSESGDMKSQQWHNSTSGRGATSAISQQMPQLPITAWVGTSSRHAIAVNRIVNRVGLITETVFLRESKRRKPTTSLRDDNPMRQAFSATQAGIGWAAPVQSTTAKVTSATARQTFSRNIWYHAGNCRARMESFDWNCSEDC